MASYVLVFNIGSSSNKLSAFSTDMKTVVTEPVWESSEDLGQRERAEVLDQQLKQLAGKVSLKDISIVGHRIVHGGRKFRQSTAINDEVQAEIERLCELAPLHNPAGLAGIELAKEHFPDCPQVAVFDTALHASMPRDVTVYALPYSWYEDHEIQRYGFHGINHAYVAKRAAEILKADEKTLRLVSCHLGNGCSTAAIKGGRSVYTSMGYTPLEGLVMGSRSGSIDPGIIVHALNSGLVTQAELDNLLNKQSGLKGISGTTNDMRELSEKAAAGDERCQLAIDIFVHHLRCEIAAAAATMDGADAIIFTGGIGENATAIREQACASLTFMGVFLDKTANRCTGKDGLVSTEASPVKILVVTAEENLAIARDCLQFAGAEIN